MAINIQILTEKFTNLFNAPPQSFYFSPGRINLIGEHLDYNNGHVFPAAISAGTFATVSKRDDNEFHLFSVNFKEDGVFIINLDQLDYQAVDKWANYPKGVLKYITETSHSITHGLNICYYGDIPNGAGLSSSASIELLTTFLLNDIYHLNLSTIEQIKIGKKVENDYIGLNSGIMDQFAIGMGKKDHALLLNCEDLSYSYAPFKLNNHTLIVINSNKRRELADSKYNERRTECESALKQLQKKLAIEDLCDLSPEQFEENIHLIDDSKLVKRARHVVYENNRTLQSFEALRNNDLKTFGRLMNESHQSLKDHYEVTGHELDTIYNISSSLPYVLGSRMTGAGFGGCAIALVENESTELYKQTLINSYSEEIGYEPDVYEFSISDGPRKLEGAEIK